MGRIIKEITIGGKKVNALFDTGSERSYITKDALPDKCSCERLKKPFTVGIGGDKREVKESCALIGEIDNLEFDMLVHPIDDLLEIDGEKIGIIVGATAMEEWDIKLNPDKKELDLTGLKKREFVEF